jgi:hypothetical protein
MTLRPEARHTSAEDRMRSLNRAAERLSAVRAGHTADKPRTDCVICRITQFSYEVAYRAYTDPFGSKVYG